MMRLKILLMTFLLALPMMAQMTSTLSCRRYTTQDGLPQMQTETLFQDARGYIYIGTLSGFVRFDGRTFTPFLSGHRSNIVSFMECSDGVHPISFRQHWRLDADDLYLHPLDAQGRWLLNNFNSPDLPSGYVLFEDEQEEHRWVAKTTNLHDFALVADHEVLDKMMPDRKLCLDASTLYVPTGEGLFRLSADGKSLSLVGAGDGFYSLCRQGDTLYAFAEDGIYTVDGDSAVLRTAYHDWQADYGLYVRTAQDGTMLIADSHSIYSYDGTCITKLAGGFNLIKALFVDRWDRLWVATYQGLYCFFNRHFTNYSLDDNDDIVRGIGVLTQPVQGTLNGKIISGGRILYDNADDFFLPSAAVIDSCVYLAGRNDIACVRDSTVKWLGIPFERYQFVAEAQGRLIVGTRQVIAAYDPSNGNLDTLSADVRHPWCAAADNGGHLFVGTSFGLFCLSLYDRAGQRAEQVHFPQKLIISTMEADPQGTVFFASGDSLFFIRQGQVQELNSQMPQLRGHEVRSIHVSPKGYLVVAALDGLFVCRVSDDYRLSDVSFFNHLNGFTIVEPQMATMAESTDGRVWLCGLEQMTSFRPADLVADSQADTFVRPPLRWYEHWWVWLLGLLLLLLLTALLVQWMEKRRSRRKMLRLQRQKQEREELIRTIREEAIRAERSQLADSIVKMTDKPETKRLTLRTAKGTMVVDAAAIVYLKADGNYTQLVTFADSDLVLTGLGTLARQLEGGPFVRADRSTLVNTGYIYKLNAAEHRCIFKSADGVLLETTLLAPAFKRLEGLM